jgi:hypothetical protein
MPVSTGAHHNCKKESTGLKTRHYKCRHSGLRGRVAEC